MLKKIKEYKEWLVIAVGIISIIWGVFMRYQGFIDKNEELITTIKTTQQMALKSVIWNEEIPIAERASACDVYLNAGYNSLTKKECESILEKGANQGIFSYAEKGSEKNGELFNLGSVENIRKFYINSLYVS